MPARASIRNSATVVTVVEMRTRSSRLFFVLLHLVGVSTNVPSNTKSSSSTSAATTPSATSSTATITPASTAGRLVSFLRKHRPSWLTWSVGIVGVHPTAILLERLRLESSWRGLKGVLERVENVWGWDGDGDLLGYPYWFQVR